MFFKKSNYIVILLILIFTISSYSCSKNDEVCDSIIENEPEKENTENLLWGEWFIDFDRNPDIFEPYMYNVTEATLEFTEISILRYSYLYIIPKSGYNSQEIISRPPYFYYMAEDNLLSLYDENKILISKIEFRRDNDTLYLNALSGDIFYNKLDYFFNYPKEVILSKVIDF